MCDCITQIDEQLKEYNTAINCTIPLDSSPARVRVETLKADPKNRKKPMALTASYCPFCGQPYEAKS